MQAQPPPCCEPSEQQQQLEVATGLPVSWGYDYHRQEWVAWFHATCYAVQPGGPGARLPLAAAAATNDGLAAATGARSCRAAALVRLRRKREEQRGRLPRIAQYECRKAAASKRPRVKGRFVKRETATRS